MNDPGNLVLVAFLVAIVIRLFWRTLANLLGVTLLTVVLVGIFTFVTATRR